MRTLLIAIGLLSLALGLIGVLVPLLPTTPFLLLSAACFSRASQRLHAWLLRLPVAGQVLGDYAKGRGVSPRSKLTALILVWLGMGTSALALATSPGYLLGLAALAIGVSVHIAMLPGPSRGPAGDQPRQ